MNGTLNIPDFAFFFGAGASVPAGVPTMKELANELEKEPFMTDDTFSTRTLVDLIMRHPNCRDQGYLDLEVFLELLHQLIKKEYVPLYYIGNYDPIFSNTDFKALLSQLYSFIVAKVHASNPIRHYTFLEHSFQYVKPGIVLTTNYDTCIEEYLAQYNISYNDLGAQSQPAFSGNYNPQQIYLLKLHGSLLWMRGKGTSIEPMSVGVSRALMQSAKSNAIDRVMVYPAISKDLGKLPFSALHRDFEYILGDISLLVVVGYRFRDDYIIDMLESACRSNNKLRIIYIDKDAHNNVKRLREYLHKHYGDYSLASRMIYINCGIEELNNRLSYNDLREYERKARNGSYHFVIDMILNGINEYSGDALYDMRAELIEREIRISRENSEIKGISFIMLPELSLDETRDIPINKIVATCLIYLMDNVWIRGRWLAQYGEEAEVQANKNRSKMRIPTDNILEAYDVESIITTDVTEYVPEIYWIIKDVSVRIEAKNEMWAKTKKILHAFALYLEMCIQLENAESKNEYKIKKLWDHVIEEINR